MSRGVASRQSPVTSEVGVRGVVPPPLGGRLGGGRSEQVVSYDSPSYSSSPLVLGMAPPQPSPYGGGGFAVALLGAPA